MAKVKYLSRYADSQPDAIRKAKIEARKAYQKTYQANYVRKTPKLSLNEMIYKRDHKKRLEEAKENK